jgi:hypothetical protein
MTPLTNRQEKAATLARELQAMGVAITSPLPLDEGSPLRCRIPDAKRDEVLEEFKNGSWEVGFLGSGPEFRLDGSTPLSHLYEIYIPVERTAVANDRIPTYPLADRERDASYANSESAKIGADWFGKKGKSWR